MACQTQKSSPIPIGIGCFCARLNVLPHQRNNSSGSGDGFLGSKAFTWRTNGTRPPERCATLSQERLTGQRRAEQGPIPGPHAEPWRLAAFQILIFLKPNPQRPGCMSLLRPPGALFARKSMIHEGQVQEPPHPSSPRHPVLTPVAVPASAKAKVQRIPTQCAATFGMSSASKGTERPQ